MRKISSLTLVLSDRCNFSCPYCPQQRGKNTLKFQDICDFLDLLRTRLAREAWLGFYGGEPLLSWPLVKKIVAYAENKFKNRFRFTLTTNGSLLTKEQVLFFRDHRFSLGLSYDGMAQKFRDAASVTAVKQALETLLRLYPEGYTVNSVFTPHTVKLLAASMEKLLRRGHRRLRYSLDLTAVWHATALEEYERQLERLAASCLDHRKRTGELPLENFMPQLKPGIFACAAGRDRLALLPDRTVWGCEIFHTLLGHDRDHPDHARYCFGTLEDFTTAPRAAMAGVTAHYSELRQDFFISDRKELCGLCANLEYCSICPGTAALATGVPGIFPSWLCRMSNASRAAVAAFPPHRAAGGSTAAGG